MWYRRDLEIEGTGLRNSGVQKWTWEWKEQTYTGPIFTTTVSHPVSGCSGISAVSLRESSGCTVTLAPLWCLSKTPGRSVNK